MAVPVIGGVETNERRWGLLIPIALPLMQMASVVEGSTHFLDRILQRHLMYSLIKENKQEFVSTPRG